MFWLRFSRQLLADRTDELRFKQQVPSAGTSRLRFSPQVPSTGAAELRFSLQLLFEGGSELRFKQQSAFDGGQFMEANSMTCATHRFELPRLCAARTACAEAPNLDAKAVAKREGDEKPE